MNIAYLILCHKNPKQVQMLVNTLKAKHTDFYIHVDKKTNDFTLLESNNVFLLPYDRCVDVKWATKSMVVATMELIHFMLEHKKEYDYVFLISGQDFPIKTSEEIEKYLIDNHGCNFIEVLSHSDNMYKRYKKRNDLYYPTWMQDSKVLKKIIKKLYIYLSGGYKYTFRPFRRKNTTGLSFEFGSQWWCLTYDCLKWIANYIDKHKILMDFFEYALTPDECLFQTVFMHSPFKYTQHDKITYLEWSENKNNPRILKSKDYNLLKQSDCLFARKFDIDIDETIVKLLIKGEHI